MRWAYFLDHYDNWSGSTQRKHISELEDMGSASDIAEVCNYLCDDAVAGALVRKAIKQEVFFSAKDIITLDGVLDDSDMEHVVRSSLKADVSFSFEEIEDLCGVVDDPLFSEIINAAIRQGISFTSDQVDWLIGNVNEATLTKAVKASKDSFSRDQLENLDGEIDDDLLQGVCKKQGIDLYVDDTKEEGEAEVSVNDSLSVDAIDDAGLPEAEIDGFGHYPSDGRKKTKKSHGGMFTFLAAISGLGRSHAKTENRFHVGDHVRVRYRGQEGTIIDINGSLYMVSLEDGEHVDSYRESDLEEAR